ncbi:MAG: SpoIIE family protein phosphatase [Spirochaetales bacterium]|nr:SpoIIE family protein phosphatase [Spirochaetales bacterium]
MKLLHTLINTIPIPVFYKDREGRYRFCNWAFERFFSIQEQDIVGKTAFDLWPADNAIKYDEKDRELFENSGMQEYEWTVGGGDGSPRDVVFRKAVVVNDDGKIIGLVGTIQDITEQKRNREKSQRELAVANALARLYIPLITPRISLSDIAQVVLEEAKKITSSAHGFVGVVSPVTGDLISLTLTDMMQGQCTIEDIENQRIVFPANNDGSYPALWGHALNTGRVFFTNNSPEHPSAKGIPPGHIPLKGFLGAPVLLQDENAGLIGLSHPEDCYTEEDAAAVKRIAEFYALAIRKKRVEEHVTALLNESISANEKLRVSEQSLAEYSVSLERNIQEAMACQKKLVALHFPVCGIIQAAGQYFPCENIGGDIYNVIRVKNKIVFYLCDISGHGVSAAMLSTFVKAYLDDWIRFHNITSPEILMKRLQNLLVEHDLFSENFLTIFAGAYHLFSRKLDWISAGHPLPLLSNSRLYALDDIGKVGPLLSGILSAAEYENNETTIPKQTRMLLYSDGLIEWSRNGDEVFGTKGLYGVFRQNGLSAGSVEAVVHKVQSLIQKDDVSYIFFDFATELKKTYHLSLDTVKTVLDEFEQFIHGRYMGDVFIRALQCFSECVLNAVEHGNKNNPERKTSVTVSCFKKKISFSVQDEGGELRMPFLQNIRRPHRDSIRGRGLFLVNKFANRVRIIENKNVISCDIF